MTARTATSPSLALVGLLLLTAVNVHSQEERDLQKLEQIIAVVGNEIILQSDVDAQLFQMEASGMPVDDVCPVVDQLMLQKLLLHQARLDSIMVDDGEVASQIDRRLEYYVRMFGSIEAFEAEYGKTVAAWKAEFREPMREQIMADRMQGEIEGQVRATPRDISDHFTSIPTDSLPLIPEEVRYSQLLIEPELSEEQKLATRVFLDSIRSEVVAGRLSLTLAAMRHSEDPGSKYKGGCYEDIPRGQFLPEFEAAVFDTPIGDLSPVFETDYGFHFLRTVDRRGQVFSACHVLMSAQIDPIALDDMGADFDELMQDLRAQEISFSDAVLQNSTRESTRNQGGLVVNPRDGSTLFGSDELDPNLFFLLNGMAPGEVSDAIQLLDDEDQGYWIAVQLEERVPAHRANPSQDFGYFQNIVEASMRETQLNDWMRKAINDTYVRIDAPYSDCTFQQDWTAGSTMDRR